MKTEKYSKDEKRLCNIQEYLINTHLKSCSVCQASMESYKTNLGIPTSPMCKRMTEGLQDHISQCPTCNGANDKWNQDAIPISDEMRRITSRMTKGIATTEELKQLQKELMDKLGVKLF